MDIEESELDPTTARLRRFEDMARRLWPYVRMFPLCGCEQEAAVAVADLAKLIGKDATSHESHALTAEHAKRHAVDGVAAFLETNGKVHLKIGNRLAVQVADLVRRECGVK